MMTCWDTQITGDAVTRIRIAHVATVDVSLKALLRPQVAFLCSQGYDVEMIASAGPHTAGLRKAGFTVHNVSISRRIEPLGDMVSAVRLARLFRAQRYDLVHTHTSKAGFVGRLAARLAGVPMVVHTAHGFFFHENMSLWQHRIFEGIERLASRWTDLMFLQSPEDYEYVQQCQLIPAERARWLGNGVDLSRFDPDAFDVDAVLTPLRQTLFGDGDHFFALMVASMIERKGHIHLIRAVSHLHGQYPQLRVLLVGVGPLMSELKADVAAAGLDNVVLFAGYREDVPQLMAAADVYVLPSLSEGMPRSIIEAMGMQCPVIASDIRGSRELVVNGETGILFTASDAGSLAAALRRLIDDPAIGLTMGRAGRARALAEYDEELVFARLEAGYQDLFRSRGVVHGDE